MVKARSVEEINAPPPMAAPKKEQKVNLTIASVKKGEPNIREDDFKYIRKPGGIPLISLDILLKSCESVFKEKKWPSMYAHVQILKKWREGIK